MGSCKSFSIINRKTDTQVPINIKYTNRTLYTVNSNDITFLRLLYKELCVRNNSKKQLEISVFLMLIQVPVISTQGLLGERLFYSLDQDRDGYIDEDTFISVFDKYEKLTPETFSDELFYLADLKNDGIIDKQELLIAVSFIQFSSLIQEMLETSTKPVAAPPNSSTDHYTSRFMSNYESSVSTFATLNERKPHKNLEGVIDSIFSKFSSNNQTLIRGEFYNFCMAYQWILMRFKQCFRFQAWKTEMMMVTNKNIVSRTDLQGIQNRSRADVKIWLHGQWNKRTLEIRDAFLLIFNEKKKIDEVTLLEFCIVKTKNCNLALIYSTQYDERYLFSFQTPEACKAFEEHIKIAGKLRRFKDFYKLKDKIGNGKFSEVYIAIELSTNIQYAAKIINKRMLDQSEREMIRREVSILRNLNYSGIIRLKEVFDSHKSFIIVMEYITSGELLKKIRQEEMKEENVRSVIKSILKAVDYLHRLGVMHRDLKPENILILEEGGRTNVKIIDFGLSTYFLPNEVKRFKCGTLGYTAPEVFDGKYTYKIDMWSIGVIAYAYFTGKLPFFSYSKEELVELTQTKEVSFCEGEWGPNTEQARDFITKLLCKDPEKRLNCQQALSHCWIMKTN